jgi:hypothetical protein
MYDKLPRVRYITPQGFKEVSDITATFKVLPKVIEEGAYPINVAVPETDRPEVFAHRVYGDPKMHWVILNMNNMVNPYYDWVLSQQSFDNMMEEKYPGYTLFLTDVSTQTAFEGSFRVNDIVFSTEETNPDLQPDIESSLKNARVVSYDPAYCRLVMEFTQKTSWIPTEGEFIAGSNLDRLGVATYYVAKIGKVIESPYAAHHFENSDKELLNPTVPIAFHNTFMGENDFGFTFGGSPLGRYIFEDFGDYTITNREYEVSVNDTHRMITLVSQEYLKNINSEVGKLLDNG